MITESDVKKCQNLRKELEEWFEVLPEECQVSDNYKMEIINLDEEPIPENGMLVFTYDNKQLDDFYSYLYMLNK